MGAHFSPFVSTVGACGWFARHRSISVMSSARVVFLSGNRQACPTWGVLGCPEYVMFAGVIAHTSSLGVQCIVHLFIVPVGGVGLSGASLLRLEK